MTEVLNDFGLLKRIYVFSSKGDPVGTGYQSDRLPNRTGYQSERMTGLTGTQSPSRGLELVRPYMTVVYETKER